MENGNYKEADSAVQSIKQYPPKLTEVSRFTKVQLTTFWVIGHLALRMKLHMKYRYHMLLRGFLNMCETSRYEMRNSLRCAYY